MTLICVCHLARELSDLILLGLICCLSREMYDNNIALETSQDLLAWTYIKTISLGKFLESWATFHNCAFCNSSVPAESKFSFELM